MHVWRFCQFVVLVAAVVLTSEPCSMHGVTSVNRIRCTGICDKCLTAIHCTDTYIVIV